jgi:nicotinamide mononucleotide (NMN) deamidase PncC
VFVGLNDGRRHQVRRFVFQGDRMTVRESGSRAALEMLKDFLNE